MKQGNLKNTETNPHIRSTIDVSVDAISNDLGNIVSSSKLGGLEGVCIYN